MPLQVRLAARPKARARKRTALEYEDVGQAMRPVSLRAAPEPALAEVIESDDDAAGDTDAAPAAPAPERKKGTKLARVERAASTSPFVREVYVPTDGGSAGAQDYVHEHGIVIRNTEVQPVTDWYALGLPLPMITGLEKVRFLHPTPIQAAAVPIIMSGRDLLGVAPTGSGKTLAFMLPLCRHVLANRGVHSESRGPQALILAPTRELSVQIHTALSSFATALGIDSVCCYGGTDISRQVAKIVANKADVIVATPGRLVDLLVINGGRVLSLSGVTFLVIDEIDRMCDLGFGPQVRSIISATRSDRQSVLFSATISGQHSKLLDHILHDAAEVEISQNVVVESVSQSAVLLSEDQKLRKLLELVKSDQTSVAPLAIVFVDTQSKVDLLVVQLAACGVKSMGLHGGMDQLDRSTTLAGFRDGEFPILIATSVAARGIDVKHLRMVINYDAASHTEDYIHRAGRTGRAGESGVCISFVTPEQGRQAYDLSQMFEVSADVAEVAEQYYNMATQNGGKIRPLGFGGSGLARLDKARDAKKSIESEVFAEGAENTLPQPERVDVPAISEVAPGSFSVKLPINDIGKRARVAVTSPARQNDVIQRFEVTITIRGEYTRHASKAGDSTLHLLIEGRSRSSVLGAYLELMRTLNEEEGRESKYAVL